MTTRSVSPVQHIYPISSIALDSVTTTGILVQIKFWVQISGAADKWFCRHMLLTYGVADAV